jgi:pyruvate-formate lyase
MTDNNRITRLRDEVMRRKGSWIADPNPFERDVALYRTKGRGLSSVQIRAAMLRELVDVATIRIYDDWTIAGEHLAHSFGFYDPKNHAQEYRLYELGITADEAINVEKYRHKWDERTQSFYAIGDISPENRKGMGDWEKNNVYLANGWMENHSIRDYAKVLRIGYAGIRREIETLLKNADITDADFPQKENFWKAALWVCDAGIALGKRYADLARSMGKLEMATMCDRVPAEGARTLREATQSLWLAHILTCGEDSINANSIGRLDKILYPYYLADIDAGRITRADAVELMEELACKLYLDYEVQAITLGGVDEHGNSAVNEMSYIILEASKNVDFIRDLSVRINSETPKEFVDYCAEMVIRGGGIPFFFNDDCFIKALADRGISLVDARDYAPIGCIELTIPGKANPHAVSGWINAAKCMELAIFDGCDPGTGEQLGPHTGLLTDFIVFDDYLTAFKKQLEFFTRNMVYNINRGELAQREKGPLPCWSLLTDDCITRGRDITDGGPIYNYHSVCFLGTANTADSLMALKKLVFEQGKIDKDELLDALKANFDGHEELRQTLLKGAEKYGNDNSEVDDFATWLTNHFIDLMDTYRSPLNGRFFVHLFSFLLNINFGKCLGATPDGRFANEPIAYSLSAQQGRDEKGVTALINTLAKLPHHRAAGASAAIIDIDPKMVSGADGVERLSQIIRAAIRMGVGQMQFNVVTVERLRQAQQDPEKYGNIPVRVAGYSQMFKLLSDDLQEHVIARTKHTM